MLLAACGTPSSAASKPSGAATATARTSASPENTSLNCKLPIFFPTTNGIVQGGWATFPGGQTQSDSSAAFSRSGNLISSAAKPTLTGDGPTFYDRFKARWVPVGQPAVSDDGDTYVYVAAARGANPNAQTLHVVTVSSGRDRPISLPPAQTFETWRVLQYAAGHVFLTRVGSEGPGTPGLWQLDPATGQVQQLFNDQTPVAVQGQSAWFETVNRADAGAITDASGGGKLPDQVERRGLPSGPSVPWEYKPGSWVQLLGVDNDGHPFVGVMAGQSSTDSMKLMAVRAPNVDADLYDGTVAESDALAVNFTDQHGTWFGGDRGLFLRAGGGHLQQVSATAARPAGRCS